MSLRPISFIVYALCLLLAFALAPAIFPNQAFRTALGDIVPLVVLGATFFFSARNAYEGRGHARLFWSLVAASMAMWCFNQVCWTWFEVILRKPLPDPFVGDIVLFMHIVPLMGAVAIRPHRVDKNEGILTSALNVLILGAWWIVIYAYFVFPQEYIVTDRLVYTLRWDILYVVETLVLIAIAGSAYFSGSGAWRKLYGGIFVTSVAYSLASEAMNAAIERGAYKTGGLYDIPFLAALFGFLGLALIGRRTLQETEIAASIPRTHGGIARVLAQLALLSLPVIGYAALFLSQDPPCLRRIRFAVTMGGVAVLALFVFLRQYLLDQRLVELLHHSRNSFDNLERLQGRAVQQAKLASLGELVALAASELEYPLSAILGSTDSLAASSNLTCEQLSNAQKIGQQAHRTHELVSDLLSFARQTPGEKSPLDLKPLLQRAVQMEGFKLENRSIMLSVESADGTPRVLGNANQLLQAFVQIIENAIDALQEVGGGRLQVTISREEEDVVVRFADSGPGLRHPERVFDPFYTTKPVGKGTGLGLSATYGVVQDHQGQITCFNRPEGGAAFEIRLPALKAGSAMPATAHA